MTEDLRGLHHGYPEAAYHGHQGSLSVTGAKTLLKAPALYQWERENPAHKDVWDEGSAAHAVALGVGMESIYVAPYDDWTRRKGPEGGVKYTTDEKAIGRANGWAVILPKQWKKVCDMAEVLSQHRLAMELMSQGDPEVSAWCPDDRTGVLRRSRFDYLAPQVIVDYKSAASSDPDAFVRAAFDFGYYMQHPWYVDIARDLGVPVKAFAFVVQMKDPPYLVTVVELPRELVAAGRRRNRLALEVYRDCTQTGLWPGYVPDTDFATPSAPAWMTREDDR